MKKILNFSIILNVLLILIITSLLYSHYKTRNNCKISKKNTQYLSLRKRILSDKEKTDPVFIYNSKKFPCDSKYGSYEINLCLSERLHFVDSLLNVLVKSNLKEFDLEIARNKEGVLKAKDNTYFVNSLKMNIASKENFIKYQKKWQELRELNSQNIQIGCEGGTGCSGIVSSAEIKFVLKRIEEIKKISGYN
ncbi:hypothetical protein N4T20_11920 [Flavobacterium sp. TR2]|uniref:hypothetical protein n=1 Tax=Flavobacterium sp. TR2 TaxID=2977321 RepID=UPI0021B14995|nr:hypothetical protein [Flavobacterium sp. TR2]UWY26420.1 hypothetical protein N4T20_11920 [Flavobacterium sp. TR2]